jgi:response regulator RpfG family c-di-GMP phosphodiesterase
MLSCHLTFEHLLSTLRESVWRIGSVKKALVVDDKKENRRLVAEALVRYGFTDIIEAENGQLAVEQDQVQKLL